MKRNKSISLTATTFSYLALIAGGFGLALLVLRTTNLPQKLNLINNKSAAEPKVVEADEIDGSSNDSLKNHLSATIASVEAKRAEHQRQLDLLEKREIEVASLEEVKRSESDLDFSKLIKESHFLFLQRAIESNNRLLAALSELRGELDDIKALVNSITLLKSRLASEEEIYKSKLEEFNQALAQRLSPTKEFFLYLLTLKFIWGLFTGYARTHYPYAQREKALEAKRHFEEVSKKLNLELADLKASLEIKVRSLEAVAIRIINSVVASERPVFLTDIRVNFLKPIQDLVAKIDLLRAREGELATFKGRVQSLREDGASFSPQYTPKSLVRTVGQAFFKLEESELEQSQEQLSLELARLEDEGIVELLERLTTFLNDLELRVNQFASLTALSEGL